MDEEMTSIPVEDVDVDQHHPTGLCDVEEVLTYFLDRLDQSQARPGPLTVFHRGGCKPEVVVREGSPV